MLKPFEKFIAGVLFGFIIVLGISCIIGPFIAFMVFGSPIWLLLYLVTIPILCGIWAVFDEDD